MITFEQLVEKVAQRLPAVTSTEVRAIVSETLSQMNLAVNEYTGEIFDPTPKATPWKAAESAPLSLRDRRKFGEDHTGRGPRKRR